MHYPTDSRKGHSGSRRNYSETARKRSGIFHDSGYAGQSAAYGALSETISHGRTEEGSVPSTHAGKERLFAHTGLLYQALMRPDFTKNISHHIYPLLQKTRFPLPGAGDFFYVTKSKLLTNCQNQSV